MKTFTKLILVMSSAFLVLTACTSEEPSKDTVEVNNGTSTETKEKSNKEAANTEEESKEKQTNHAMFTDRYDDIIEDASEMYMPGVEWELWKAQLYQESKLEPMAESPVGARGLAQFMPATWQQISEELGYGNVAPTAAKPSIHAGAYYMGKLRANWSSPRPEMDRHYLAASSYNAGLGNLLKAQKACDMKVLYSEIIECLPEITGHHSKETITYIKRIKRWFLMMR